MIPPDRGYLRALAGWSLTARENCSSEQQVALQRFGDAAGGLSEVIDGVNPVVRPPAASPKIASPTLDRQMEIPAAVRQVPGVPTDGPCGHNKFDIRTQKCLHCGLTYRQAMGRRAELM